MKQPLIILLLAALLTLLTGCLLPPKKARTPMRTVWLQQAPDARADALVIFLPGRDNSPEEFVSRRFVELLWAADIRADVVLADAHTGYYRERQFSQRLHEDVLVPARAMGYVRIWVVGVSLGGFGAMMFERDHPGAWDGIVVLAPFLGDDRAVLSQVRNRSTLADLPIPGGDSPDDYTANFWRWMQQYEQSPGPPILMGYGLNDRLRREQDVLAAILGGERVVTLPGGHTWSVWVQLWQELLPMLAGQLGAAEPSR